MIAARHHFFEPRESVARLNREWVSHDALPGAEVGYHFDMGFTKVDGLPPVGA